MCKMNEIHDACKTGSRDGMNFPIESCNDEVIRFFSRQFRDERARDAYCSNFLMELGKRVSPVNEVRMRTFAMA